jgi:NAD(P)-dependent dehydrogenase (short-subunit alcohol dehydrogenase family)
MDWTNRVAVVTGGASGIGQATAQEFAQSGTRVAIFDIQAERSTLVRDSLVANGGVADIYAVDVANHDAVNEAVKTVAERWGRIDFLVNNAFSFISKGLDVTPADWERCLGTNVRGYANTVQACYPFMRVQRGSAIVNISSISAHIAQPNRWTYNATNGAVVSMTKCQALDLSADGIRVNAVSPGWIWTPEVSKAANGDRAKWEPVWGKYHMLRRFGEPREVARAILFLCSDDASFITGTELMVDGGYLGLGSEGLGETSSFAGSQ